ncbi:Hypothetical predicted protein [Cloeon dipterum]|nr:Hypothetical predicted protein [Cloeon dipterum]
MFRSFYALSRGKTLLFTQPPVATQVQEEKRRSCLRHSTKEVLLDVSSCLFHDQFDSRFVRAFNSAGLKMEMRVE